MRFVVTAFALLATIATAAAATDAELKAKIVGSWGPTDTCEDGPLVFGADGSFALKGPPGTPAEQELTGTFTIVDGKLAGKTPQFDMDTVPVSFDGDKLIMGAPGPDADVLVKCKMQ
jgi:hypothetical protein